jgi:hypothetical protein
VLARMHEGLVHGMQDRIFGVPIRENSGYGREKGIEALHDYAQVKAISAALIG